MSAHSETLGHIKGAADYLSAAQDALDDLPDMDDLESDIQSAASDAQSLAESIDQASMSSLAEAESNLNDLHDEAAQLAANLDEIYRRL